MHRIMLTLGVCAGLLASAPALAQAEPQGGPAAPPFPPPTLARALQEAWAADPGLAAARNTLAATPGLASQAAAIPNPELSALREGGDAATRSTTYQINQTVELGGKRSARVKAASEAQALARAELELRGAELRAGVTTAYYDAIAAEAHLAYARDAQALAARAADTVARRVKAGKVSPVEDAKARLAESAARIEAAQAAGELAAARQQLAQLLGRSYARLTSGSDVGAGESSACESRRGPGTDPRSGTPVPASACGAEGLSPESRLGAEGVALPELPPPALLAARYARSPLLAKAQAESAHSAALAGVERSRQSPDLTLSVGVKREGEAQRRQNIIGISVPLPLFDRNQGRLAEALGRADTAQAELRSAAVRVEGEYRLAREQVIQRAEEARLVRDTVIPAAQSAFDASAKGYEYGKFNLIDVLDAQRTLVAARTQYTQALREAWRAYARLERILGPDETKENP
ncbi:TolC family protein [Pseudoduganella namucuonensis]|uniref:Outer membrane protein, cobalt-zinc-cadmium efflux system n=1 Tax=Pseudoduganella namucuonensis TaxID=1035707 RepID=A0A1I7HNC7_9BURK|nr:TolC family protein [Pseudoduganella namucuonensis]SFU62163.1 outer membrane protein, cobalt-zinc-cadmium efflux system [Pseudoduganella namucuonensis]